MHSDHPAPSLEAILDPSPTIDDSARDASPSLEDIRANAQRIRERMAQAAEHAGRDPGTVKLMAVTKTVPPRVVARAVRADLTLLGENRVQEAAAKLPEVETLLAGVTRPRWHMIGHLQTNKAGDAVRLFHAVQSVDSVRLAKALARRLESPLEVLLEVYVGDEPDRPGLRPDALSDAAGQISELPHLVIGGLMTVAPLGWDSAATSRAFATVRALSERLAREYPRVNWSELSMGMTDDFEAAIAEGSTLVRIGRALFGPREAS